MRNFLPTWLRPKSLALFFWIQLVVFVGAYAHHKEGHTGGNGNGNGNNNNSDVPEIDGDEMTLAPLVVLTIWMLYKAVFRQKPESISS